MLRTEKSRPGGSSKPVSLTVLGLLVLAFPLGGCVSDGGPTASTPSPAYTGSIPVSTAPADKVSDRDVVRAAVTGPETVGATIIPWANAATGTTGVISQVVEQTVAGRTCRSFQTSRHSYNGISLYVGEACRPAGGDWRLIEFRPRRGADTLNRPDGTGVATG